MACFGIRTHITVSLDSIKSNKKEFEQNYCSDDDPSNVKELTPEKFKF